MRAADLPPDLDTALSKQHGDMCANEPKIASIHELDDVLRHVTWHHSISGAQLLIQLSAPGDDPYWGAVIGVERVTVDTDTNTVTFTLADPLPKQDDGDLDKVQTMQDPTPDTALIVTPATTSKGPEWWAGFQGYAPIAVSEVSPVDATAQAERFLAAHGWRPEMGGEVGMLLIACYERGRTDQLMIEKPHLADDDYVMLTARNCTDPVRPALDDE